MKRRIAFLARIAVMCMPSPLKNACCRKFFGWEIHKTAKIGFSYIESRKVVLKAGASIGHLNLIRGLSLLELGEGARIGNLNAVSALPLSSRKHFTGDTGRFPSLVIGNQSGVTARHYFDCNHSIAIGSHTIVAGFQSAFLTHGINIATNRQEAAPIVIGDYCMIGARSVMLKGAKLPSYSVLAANSTLHKAHDRMYAIYSGVPAGPVKDLDRDSAYFSRLKGYVD